MAFEQRARMDVQVPIGDANRKMAERVGRDVDAALDQPVALHRRKRSIVPDDLGDRIRTGHAASSSGEDRPVKSVLLLLDITSLIVHWT